MQALDVLRTIKLGNSVAEHDQELQRYFIETETFRKIVEDRGDVVTGDKGTGKSALFTILFERFLTIPELKAANVEVIPAFNITGNPIFERLNTSPPYTPPALRALLRSYLDLQAYPRLKLKLFLRNDLFRRVIGEGFVNLTHIYDRRIQIDWDDASLYALLCRRLGDSDDFVKITGSSEPDPLFNAVLPLQVDIGAKKPITWKWMLGRIRDGNGVTPPRSLIDLVQKALDQAIRREERQDNQHEAGTPLLRPDDLRAGQKVLSEQRVEDTLLAEAQGNAYLIEKFRNGKAEHNEQSLAAVLQLEGGELTAAVKFLREVGFLADIAESGTKKVPLLYRAGLQIRQGKAFGDQAASAEDEDDE